MGQTAVNAENSCSRSLPAWQLHFVLLPLHALAGAVGAIVSFSGAVDAA